MLFNKKAASCENIRALLFDYIDGELSRTDAAALEEHIAHCADCKRELEECRRMLGLVKDSASTVPAELYERVMAELENTPQNAKILTPKLRMRPWLSSIAAVAAAVMILVVGRGYIFSGRNDALSIEKSAEDARIQVSPTGHADAPYDTATYVETGAPSYDESSAKSAGASNDGEYVYVTTDSYTALTPAAPAQTAEIPVAEDAIDSEDGSLLDLVLAGISVGDSATLVCYKSDAVGVVPATECQFVSGDGVDYEYYIIDTNANVTFTGYIELFEKLSVDYRAMIPEGGEFSSAQILLIVEGED